MRNCVICGTILISTIKGEKFCPNHRVIEENQNSESFLDYLSSGEYRKNEN